MDSWRDAEARRRGAFREVNERIHDLGETFEVEGHGAFVCECGNAGCIDPVSVPREEYEDVRSHGRRFVIAPDHENPDVEVVVRNGGAYAITETFVGEASRIAEEMDPRAEADLD